MKWIKYGLLIVGLVLAGLLISAGVGYRYARQQPDFYRSYDWEPSQRSAVSQQALNKLLQTKELAAAAHFAEVRAQKQTRTSASIEAITPKIQPLTIQFTQEELNAFIFHNMETFKELKPKIEQYVVNPGIFLRDGRLILAGQIKGTDYLASAHFAPRLDEQGDLRLSFVRAMAGRLPVPKALMTDQLKRLKEAVAARLPDYQQTATMDASGGSNPSMVVAAASKLLIATLTDTAAPPVLFMPVDEKGKAMPLRLTKVEVDNDHLSITLEPMTPEQRTKMAERIRGK